MKVEIKQEGAVSSGVKVLLNDEPIKDLRGLDVRMRAGESTTVVLDRLVTGLHLRIGEARVWGDMKVQILDQHTIEIEGVRYGVELFQGLAFVRPGAFFRLESREDGVISCQTFHGAEGAEELRRVADEMERSESSLVSRDSDGRRITDGGQAKTNPDVVDLLKRHIPLDEKTEAELRAYCDEPVPDDPMYFTRKMCR